MTESFVLLILVRYIVSRNGGQIHEYGPGVYTWSISKKTENTIDVVAFWDVGLWDTRRAMTQQGGIHRCTFDNGEDIQRFLEDYLKPFPRTEARWYDKPLQLSIEQVVLKENRPTLN